MFIQRIFNLSLEKEGIDSQTPLQHAQENTKTPTLKHAREGQTQPDVQRDQQKQTQHQNKHTDIKTFITTYKQPTRPMGNRCRLSTVNYILHIIEIKCFLM